MADMTEKHHRLIRDAVAEGIAEAIKVLFDGNEEKPMRPFMVQSQFSVALGNSLAEKLRYTHDKFEGNQFVQRFTTEVAKRCKKVMK